MPTDGGVMPMDGGQMPMAYPLMEELCQRMWITISHDASEPSGAADLWWFSPGRSLPLR